MPFMDIPVLVPIFTDIRMNFMCGLREHTEMKNLLEEQALSWISKSSKKVVNESVVNKLDHKLILSEQFLKTTKLESTIALLIFPAEPTAENLLIYIRNELKKSLPADINLISLKLYETQDSYAEWLAG